MNFKQTILSFLLVCFFVSTKAQVGSQQENSSFFKGVDFHTRASFSIGGSAPIPFPVEIRRIEHYNPTLSLGLGIGMTKWLGNKEIWGIRTGLHVEGKGMKTAAEVKNYFTEVIGQGGQKVTGNFTGMVQTNAKNSYFTLPLLLTYGALENWNLYAGPYFSALVEKNFTGYVYDGYLREGGPTGTKIVFSGDNRGPYDFSQDLNLFQWGVMAGGEWTFRKHLSLFGELSWGLNNLFERDFKTITFDMYPIYLTIGLSYIF